MSWSICRSAVVRGLALAMQETGHINTPSFFRGGVEIEDHVPARFAELDTVKDLRPSTATTQDRLCDHQAAV